MKIRENTDITCEHILEEENSDGLWTRQQYPILYISIFAYSKEIK